LTDPTVTHAIGTSPRIGPFGSNGLTVALIICRPWRTKQELWHEVSEKVRYGGAYGNHPVGDRLFQRHAGAQNRRYRNRGASLPNARSYCPTNQPSYARF